MRTIAHISDLHFGRVERFADEALMLDLREMAPSLIAISGDLTQRALDTQFRRARAYLARLPAPYIVVPGNHDIPLFDVTRRFLLPLHRYKFYISAHLSPLYVDNEVTVLGVNTARSMVLESGKISPKQLKKTEAVLLSMPQPTLRVIVTHHPFVRPASVKKYRKIVGGADKALKCFEKCGVDLILSGHFHRTHAEDLRTSHAFLGRSIVHVQAGTAISSRLRNQPNSYNLITIDDDRIHVEVREWHGKSFVSGEKIDFRKKDGHWVRTGGTTQSVPVQDPQTRSEEGSLRALRTRTKKKFQTMKSWRPKRRTKPTN